MSGPRCQPTARGLGWAGTIVLLVALPTIGPLQAVVISGAAAVLLVALVWPRLQLGAVSVSVSAPRDVFVGQAFPARVRVEGRAASLEVRLPGGDRRWLDAPGDGAATACCGTRGVLTELGVQLSSAAPLGLFRWTRLVEVGLAEPVHVAPVPDAVTLDELLARHGLDADGWGVPAGSGSAAGVRDYLPGDTRRMIHWRATARRGEPVVRELEGGGPARLTIAVDLSAGPPVSERVASYVAGLTRAALAAGVRVDLVTAEDTDVVHGEVSTTIEAGRRLARAGSAPVPPQPAEMLVAVGPSW